MASGWQTKPAFFTVFVGVSILAAVTGFGIPRIVASLPPQLINLPNNQYWLAPDRAAETESFLNNYFACLGCAVFRVIILTFDYSIQSNLHPEHRPDISRMWYILAGFLAFVTVWIIRLLTRFLQTPQENLRS